MLKSLNKFLFVGVFFFASLALSGQNFGQDFKLIAEVSPAQTESTQQHSHHPTFLMANHPSALVRYNPLTLFFGSLLYVYQWLISPQFSATCIYSPSCSAFSKDLFQEYGLFLGLFFTADRISRCNRLALYDFPPAEVDTRIHKIREDVDYYRITK